MAASMAKKGTRTGATWVVALLLAGTLAGLCGAGEAVPDAVLRDMALRKFAPAAKALENIVAAQPANQAAWFFLAKARNRMGQSRKALEALAHVTEPGRAAADVHRERGIAHFGLGEADKAMAELKQAGPDDSEAWFVRGLVALRLGQKDDAKLALAKARNDPLFKKQAQQALDSLEPGKAPPPKAPRRWQLDLTVGVAYNDNVTLRAKEAVQNPAERANRAAMAVSMGLNGSYLIYHEGPTRVRALFALSWVQYEELHDFDHIDTQVGIEVQRQFEGWRARIRPTIRQAWVDGEGYVTALIIPISAEKPLTPWCSLQGNYTLRYEDYHFATPRAEDIDGVTHHFELGLGLRTLNGVLSGECALTHDRSNAQGDSMRYHAWGAQAGVHARILPRLVFHTNYAYRRPRYFHPNIRSMAFPAEKRRDACDFWSLSLDYLVRANQKVSLYYIRLNNRSNIPRFFRYTQDVVGVTYTYGF